MFKVLMITAVIILITGWIAYGAWVFINHRREKDKPKKKTEHLEKVKKSFDDYIKRLQDYKRKPYQRK